MSTPTSGFYEATVTLDSGVEIEWPVRVSGVAIFSIRGTKILPTACRDFKPMSYATAAEFWPGEIGDMCTHLEKEVKRLDKALRQACIGGWGMHRLPNERERKMAGDGSVMFREAGERWHSEHCPELAEWLRKGEALADFIRSNKAKGQT